MSKPALRAVPAWLATHAPVATTPQQLAATRVAVFAVLAIDAVLAMAHAPRYGTGFVVANAPFLEFLEPSRLGYLMVQALVFAAAIAMIWRVATNLASVVGAVFYSIGYFSSQVDSYQHHYLVALLWWLFVFVDWNPQTSAIPVSKTAKKKAANQPAPTITSGAYRVVLLLLAIVYAWAAIAKCHAQWLSGEALQAQLSTGWVARLAAAIPGGYQTLSIAMLAGEFGLAFAVWQRRWARPALFAGVAMHVAILFTPLDIGLFAWLMLALYILVSPAAWWHWRLSSLRMSGWQRVTAALVSGALALAAIVYVADVRQDYYRYWAGFARRTGKTEDATYAYQKLIRIDPKNWRAYYQLGLLYKSAGNVDDALALFRTAQQHPTDPDPWTEEAVILLERGDAAGAAERLQRALAIAPKDRRAAQYLTRLRSGQPTTSEQAP